MQLDQIISLANQNSRISFLAMERSLRAAGCHLPLAVIPYDDQRFSLPKNAEWWLHRDIAGWLRRASAHPTMRKYQCLTIGNYHFVDADIIFLDDPAVAVAAHTGVVTSCTEWNKPQWTYTPESAAFLYRTSSTWQRNVFSTGQFAIDRSLYTTEQLKATAEHPEFLAATLRFRVHEQPGLNQLVLATGLPVTNLTLPPNTMESTWAGDYPDAYEVHWQRPGTKPYLIHWAGSLLDRKLPINELFYSFLSRAERAEWDERQRVRRTQHADAYRRSLSPAGGSSMTASVSLKLP